MQDLELFIPIEAKPFFEAIFKNDPYVQIKAVAGDHNFMMLYIEDPILMDIEKIIEAAEKYGYNQGWNEAAQHYAPF